MLYKQRLCQGIGLPLFAPSSDKYRKSTPRSPFERAWSVVDLVVHS